MLGAVYNIFHLEVGFVHQADDAVGGFDEAAQDGFLTHNLGVVFCISGCGHALDNIRQRLNAPHFVQLVAVRQLFTHGEQVYGDAPLVKRVDDLADNLMRRVIKIFGLEDFGDFFERFLAEHHGAQRTHLRFGAVG